MIERSPNSVYGKRIGMSWQTSVLFTLSGLVILLASPVFSAEQPQMDTDVMLKPLVDTSQSTPDAPSSTLHGSAEKQGTIPVNATHESAPNTKVLTGKVQTLQQAIESERNTVDWYAWYLSARTYLGQTGGLPCALGTPIKFYRNGTIEALTFDPQCIASVSTRRFPLPKNTQLDALILPVRSGAGPPASPQEIYSRIESLKRR